MFLVDCCGVGAGRDISGTCEDDVFASVYSVMDVA